MIAAIATFATFGIALPAAAHHPMGGATPGTLMEGLLSGFGHPIIGVDHLLFIIGFGIACYYFGQRIGAIALFILGTLAGTLLHIRVPDVPYAEALVAASLIVLGILLFRRSEILRGNAATALFAVSGIAHGYAYGEAIIGAEATPLLAYLSGFSMVQLAIALCAYAIAYYIAQKKPAFPLPEASGAALGSIGAGFLVYALMTQG
jgi:urease accessory protein